jgi:alpha-L-fucosidase
MMTRSAFIFVLLLSLLPLPASGQRFGGGGEANPGLATNGAALKKWQAMRFGMFIHWGPVTLRGTEIGWSRGPQVAIEDYDGLYKEFNPVLFDAKEWVAAAKAAGMKYLVITTKHHDGFCLWDSRVTDYDIMATPFRRDVIRELADECQRQGIMFCTYYSILDWHHPHYTTRYGGDPRPVQDSDMNLYRQYLKSQVTELVREYRTHILWFDGEWEDSWTHQDGMDLYAYLRGLNDSLLINNRVDKLREGMAGMTLSPRAAGDFGTPEQTIGSFDNQRPWESCITIGTQWSWKPNDRIKSAQECIRTLAKTAGGGGNLLLNISPMMDGRIEQRQIERLQTVGRWLELYGESIYGTVGGPFKPTTWMSSTCKNNSIYVHLFKRPKEEIRLPALPRRKIKAVRVLGGAPLQARTAGDQLVVALPGTPLDTNDAVIKLELNGPAEELAPLDVPVNVFDNADSADVTLRGTPGYPARGAHSLTDGVRGSLTFQDQNWIGFEQEDCEAVFDLRAVKPVTRVSVGCLQVQDSWIFAPKAVEVSLSEDGTTYKPAGRLDAGELRPDLQVRTKDYVVPCPQGKGRFVKVRVVNTAVCPPWHKGAGGKAWVFVDEISIN